MPRFSRAGLPGRPAAERGQQCTLPPQLSQQLEQSVPDGHRSRETEGVSLLFVGGSSLMVLLARGATVAVVTKEHLCSLLRTCFEDKQVPWALFLHFHTFSARRDEARERGLEMVSRRYSVFSEVGNDQIALAGGQPVMGS